MAVTAPIPTDEDQDLTRTRHASDAGSSEQVPREVRLELSIVLPCLNEAENITQCVMAARATLESNGITGEILVVDNGSSDGSAELALAAGANVIRERRRGYGNAYRAGFAAARGEYILMADADLTYDFADAPRFIAALDAGADFVVGNRMGNIDPGAMPWLHRYVGNPALSGLLNFLFHTGVHDAHSGMRAIRRSVLPQLALRATGMEFASEMVIRAAKEDVAITEFPIEYHARGGESKLSSFRDGWRHMRFLLVHSPRHLFVWPGALMTAFGALIQVIVLSHVGIFGRAWNTHAMIAGVLLAVVGVQVIALGACARTYAAYFMGERDVSFDRLRGRLRLEHGLMSGGALILAGAVIAAVIFIHWAGHAFGPLAQENLALVAAALVIIGIQVFFTSFLLSILGLRRG